MLVARARDIQVAAADIVDGFIVNQESAVGVLDGAMGGQNRIVRFDDGSRDSRGRIDGKLELALLAVLGRETLKEKSTETGAGAATKGVENQKALQRVAVVYT